VTSTSAVNFLGSFIFVHISRFAADKSLVNFDFASHLLEASVLQGEPNPVIHEPRSFLSDVDSSVNFPGTNPIFIVDNHPQRSEPLVQAKRTILENGSNFNGEFPPRVVRGTLPSPALGIES